MLGAPGDAAAWIIALAIFAIIVVVPYMALRGLFASWKYRGRLRCPFCHSMLVKANATTCAKCGKSWNSPTPNP